MLNIPEDILKDLFAVFLRLVWAVGGDGCGYIVAGEAYAYEDIALAFGEELRKRDLHYFREDHDYYALFTDRRNENFIISQEVLPSPFKKDIEIIL